MATVELAAALPVLLVFVLAGLSAVRVVDARSRCLDGAREAARAAARGDAHASTLGRAASDGSAVVDVSTGGDLVTATVRVMVHPLGGVAPAIAVTETAVAAREPTAADDAPP